MSIAPDEFCAECAGSLSREHMTLPVRVKDSVVEVEGDFTKCVECGEVQLAPGEMDALLRDAAAKVREKAGLLTPYEVKAIRMRLGLTQAALERLLGVGEKTVGRWERGTVAQSATADSILRLLRDLPNVRDYLAALRDIVMPTARNAFAMEAPSPRDVAAYDLRGHYRITAFGYEGNQLFEVKPTPDFLRGSVDVLNLGPSGDEGPFGEEQVVGLDIVAWRGTAKVTRDKVA